MGISEFMPSPSNPYFSFHLQKLFFKLVISWCVFFLAVRNTGGFSSKSCPWKSPNHRITESQSVRGWKGPLWVIWCNPPAEAGSPRAGCTGPCPGGSWTSPEKENPQPPWATCSRAPSHLTMCPETAVYCFFRPLSQLHHSFASVLLLGGESFIFLEHIRQPWGWPQQAALGSAWTPRNCSWTQYHST